MIHDHNSPRKAAIYARVSTEHEEQISALDNQIAWYDTILAMHPEWKIVDWYIDEGITGTSAEKRPRFMDMIRDAKEHKFDVILTREVSRFARNTVDTLQFTRDLRNIGIEVVFLNDGIRTFDGDGELRLSLMATFAQEESRKISVRVKAGQKVSMEKGVLYGNGNILGYDRVGSEYVINPEQAQTVRMIFDWYLGGMGVTKIQYALEKAGRQTSTGKTKWYASYIAHMLKNSFYCGTITYRKEYTPDYLKQKKILNHGEIEFIRVEGTHEPIVTKEEYDRVQQLMASHASPETAAKPANGLKPHTSVWGRLLICQCGNHFNAHYHARSDRTSGVDYQCYTAVNRGSVVQRAKNGLSIEDSCNSPFISGWKLDMMAKKIFQDYIKDGSEVLELAYSMLEKHLNDSASGSSDTTEIIRQKQTEIDKLKKKLHNLIEMREDGDIDKQTFRTRKQELEAKIAVITEDLQKKTSESPEAVQEDFTAQLANLKEKLKTYIDFSAPVIPDHIVEAFIEKILVSKDEFRWYLRIGNTEINREHIKLVDFTITLEDAKKYIYSFSPKRRVLHYTDLHVSVWL